MTPSHGDMLADSLSKLEVSQSQTSNKANLSRVREGYGFRPPPGVTTPLIDSASAVSENLVPDPNGLGWPGKSYAKRVYVST